MSEEFNEFPFTIDEAVNKAAAHLPDHYHINIMIENGGCNVELEKPDGSIINTVDGGNGLVSDINEALCIANGFSQQPKEQEE